MIDRPGSPPAAAPVRAAVLLRAGEPLRITEILLPAPADGQVRVRLTAAGICRSDVALATGALRQPVPAVLGHEGTGIVSAVGPGVRGLHVGDPVLLNWAPSCGTCWHCDGGERHLCVEARGADRAPYATLPDGMPVYPGLGTAAFAEETVVSARAVLPLPPGVPITAAAVLGCAVMTGFAAVRGAGVRAGQAVVVVGVGGVGLSVVRAASLAGADPVVAVDIRAEKEPLARRQGATHFVITGPGAVARVLRLTGGRGAEHTFECAGAVDGVRLAWRMSRRGGQVTVLGLAGPGDVVPIGLQELVYFSRALRGSMYGGADPAADLTVLATHVRTGALDLGALVTGEVALAELPEALAGVVGRAGRTVVTFPAVPDGGSR